MGFESDDAQRVLRYVLEQYGTVPEFLWEKTPQNGVLRHKGNRKWYAAILRVPKQKLGFAEAGEVEVLNVKCGPIMAGSLRDHERFFAAYHMNKEHWISLLLNGTIPMRQICDLIDLSFEMTRKG